MDERSVYREYVEQICLSQCVEYIKKQQQNNIILQMRKCVERKGEHVEHVFEIINTKSGLSISLSLDPDFSYPLYVHFY